MKQMRLIMALTAAMALTACSAAEQVSRSILRAPIAKSADQQAPVGDYLHSLQFPYQITRIDVRVPSTLIVSEANAYKPIADIVWREDPFGNRHAQVQKVVNDAATQAISHLTVGYPVVVDLQVARFHAVTEKTRYSVGGTHEISYFIAVYDAQSGAQIEAPRLIQMEFQAFGGARALEAMSRGETQKVRITRELIASLQHEISYRSLPLPLMPIELMGLSSRGY